MSERNDLQYYRQREGTARRHAAAPKDPAIAAIHIDMADRYAALVAEQSEGEQRSRVQLKPSFQG